MKKEANSSMDKKYSYNWIGEWNDAGKYGSRNYIT